MNQALAAESREPKEPMKILVVDDEVGPRESIRMILKNSYRLDFAASGEAALEKLEMFKPDIVILDIRMPGIDGIETLKEIKKRSPQTQVLLATGYASLDTAIQAVKLGAFDYIVKPFDAQQIQKLADGAAEKRRKEKEDELKLQTLMKVNARLKSHYAVTLQTLLATVDVTDEQVEAAVEGDSRDLEEKLVRAEKLISLGTLSAEVAHELNNIFSGISGYFFLLGEKMKEARIASECFEFLELSSSQLNRAINIVGGILDYSRTAAKSQAAFCDLNQAIRQILSLVEFQTKKKQIKVAANLSKELPAVPIDGNLLEQLFLNFVINAIHAMPDGGLLSITTELSEDGGWISAVIRDTGCGIPPDVLEKIFEPFFTTKKEKGTGLGLAISMKLIRSIDGDIDVESEPGRGTAFTIRIPIKQARESGE